LEYVSAYLFEVAADQPLKPITAPIKKMPTRILLDKKFVFCNKDAELFWMRYAHFRSHTSLEKRTSSQIYFDFRKEI